MNTTNIALETPTPQDLMLLTNRAQVCVAAMGIAFMCLGRCYDGDIRVDGVEGGDGDGEDRHPRADWLMVGGL